ncbi:unnamed protein product [Brassica oleracea var. botrytis]
MENRSAMPFQITPSPKKLVLHESHKNLPSHNPIWKQLPLPCLEGLVLMIYVSKPWLEDLQIYRTSY